MKMDARTLPPPFQGSALVAGRPRVPLRFTQGYLSRRRFAAHEIRYVGDPQRSAPYARRLFSEEVYKVVTAYAWSE